MNNFSIFQNQASTIQPQGATRSAAGLHLQKHKLRATRDKDSDTFARKKAATSSTPSLLLVRSTSQVGGIAAIHPANNMKNQSQIARLNGYATSQSAMSLLPTTSCQSLRQTRSVFKHACSRVASLQSFNSKKTSKEEEKNIYESSLQPSRRESVEVASNSLYCESRRKQMRQIPGNKRAAEHPEQRVLNQSNVADKSENIDNSSNASQDGPLEALLELKAPRVQTFEQQTCFENQDSKVLSERRSGENATRKLQILAKRRPNSAQHTHNDGIEDLDNERKDTEECFQQYLMMDRSDNLHQEHRGKAPLPNLQPSNCLQGRGPTETQALQSTAMRKFIQVPPKAMGKSVSLQCKAEAITKMQRPKMIRPHNQHVHDELRRIPLRCNLEAQKASHFKRKAPPAEEQYLEESSKELSIALKSEGGPLGLLGDIGPSVHQTIQEMTPRALDGEFQAAIEMLEKDPNWNVASSSSKSIQNKASSTKKSKAFKTDNDLDHQSALSTQQAKRQPKRQSTEEPAERESIPRPRDCAALLRPTEQDDLRGSSPDRTKESNNLKTAQFRTARTSTKDDGADQTIETFAGSNTQLGEDGVSYKAIQDHLLNQLPLEDDTYEDVNQVETNLIDLRSDGSVTKGDCGPKLTEKHEEQEKYSRSEASDSCSIDNNLTLVDKSIISQVNGQLSGQQQEYSEYQISDIKIQREFAQVNSESGLLNRRLEYGELPGPVGVVKLPVSAIPDHDSGQSALGVNLFENTGQTVAGDRVELDQEDQQPQETSRFSQQIEQSERPQSRCLVKDPGIEFFQRLLTSYEFLNSISSDDEDEDNEPESDRQFRLQPFKMKMQEEVKKHNFRPLATRPQSQLIKQSSNGQSSEKKLEKPSVKGKVTVLKFIGSSKASTRAASTVAAGTAPKHNFLQPILGRYGTHSGQRLNSEAAESRTDSDKKESKLTEGNHGTDQGVQSVELKTNIKSNEKAEFEVPSTAAADVVISKTEAEESANEHRNILDRLPKVQSSPKSQGQTRQPLCRIDMLEVHKEVERTFANLLQDLRPSAQPDNCRKDRKEEDLPGSIEAVMAAGKENVPKVGGKKVLKIVKAPALNVLPNQASAAPRKPPLKLKVTKRVASLKRTNSTQEILPRVVLAPQTLQKIEQSQEIRQRRLEKLRDISRSVKQLE